MILILFYFKETQAIKALSDANIDNILISPTAATDETSKDHLNELFFISTTPNTVQHIFGGMKLDGMLLSLVPKTKTLVAGSCRKDLGKPPDPAEKHRKLLEDGSSTPTRNSPDFSGKYLPTSYAFLPERVRNS